jgi:hypothetical protein
LQTDVPKTDPATSKAPKKKKRAKFYAVLRGRSPGVYRSWAETKLQVDDYPGEVHVAFKTETKARCFLAAGGANDNNSSEESGDDEFVKEVYTMPRPAPARRPAPVRAAKPPPEVVPKEPEEPLFTSITNDVSKGTPKQLFGDSIVVESKVLKRLCPK